MQDRLSAEKKVTGFMRSQGTHIDEQVVVKYLPEVNLNFARARRAGDERQTNPCLYFS